MIRQQRSGKRLAALLAMAFALFSGDMVCLYAAESTGDTESVTTTTRTKDFVYNADQLGVRNAPDMPPEPRGRSLFANVSLIFVFLILLAAIAVAVVRYAKQGTFNLGKLKPIGTENKLIVLESKMLGGRQFLTVVEYNEQKMLLAVSPGRIEQLCFLESVYEEEAREAELGQDRG